MSFQKSASKFLHSRDRTSLATNSLYLVVVLQAAWLVVAIKHPCAMVCIKITYLRGIVFLLLPSHPILSGLQNNDSSISRSRQGRGSYCRGLASARRNACWHHYSLFGTLGLVAKSKKFNSSLIHAV